MYESFLIGFVGAIAGSLLTGRSFKGALEEKLSLTYDMTCKTHQEVAQVSLEQKHFDARFKSDIGELSKLAASSVEQIEKVEEEKEEIKEYILEMESKLVGVETELNQAKQAYVEMATKANEEIGKLQGTVTTYHNALMEASRKNQELSVALGMQKGN
jgi:predicted RNase H-like nuclease (RuvC/YqgF family)